MPYVFAFIMNVFSLHYGIASRLDLIPIQELAILKSLKDLIYDVDF